MGWAPLHNTMLPAESHDQLVAILVEHGANVNVKDDFGRTPLHRAAQYGHKNGVIALLKAEADPTLKDNKGVTATGRAS